ncbi:MAG: DNA polymerase subunit beta [Promethearchaeota archaeon CR_4]|nr:MAG: DNA polymerase subunit beta [Candidatus Lokiarchaeota archaeon CR_4]
MTRNQSISRIAKVRGAITPILREFGVKRTSVFGSVMRGDFSRRSDIDILVDLPEGSTLLDLMRLEIEMKGKIRQKVDVVTFDSLHPLLKHTILDEQVLIFP